jgi:hypothetical protein
VLLALDLLAEVWAHYVWREEWTHPETGEPFEKADEALIPAGVVNNFGPPRLVDRFADER